MCLAMPYHVEFYAYPAVRHKRKINISTPLHRETSHKEES